jgi:hypothetical protein
MPSTRQPEHVLAQHGSTPYPNTPKPFLEREGKAEARVAKVADCRGVEHAVLLDREREVLSQALPGHLLQPHRY